MEITTDSSPLSLANYQLRLPTFEGPLDLLLRLIEKSQLSITDVSLAAVTGQFLTAVDEMREFTPPDTIAEFAAVGTRLTLLKSRSLLPRPPKADEDAAVESDLTVELIEYKRVKEAARELGERFASGLALFTPATRLPVTVPAEPKDPRLVPYEAGILLRSIRRRLTSVPKPSRLIRQRRIVSIRDMIDRVTALTTLRGRVAFTTVTSGYQTRSEVATAFLAVLVLVRRRALQASQTGLFAEIDLETRQVDVAETVENDDEFLN